MARLWQTALLSEWNPIFRYLPLESHIQAFQADYYEAIAACHTAGNANAFITFMLDMISLTLDGAIRDVCESDGLLTAEVRRLLGVMDYDVPYSGLQLMAKLGLKSRDSFRKAYLLPALKQGLIVMGIPDKPTSRNQTYIRK